MKEIENIVIENIIIENVIGKIISRIEESKRRTALYALVTTISMSYHMMSKSSISGFTSSSVDLEF